MRRILSNLMTATGVLALAVGVIGVAVGVERVLTRRRTRTKPATNPPAALQRSFSIKRTKSEIGYVYWILQGYGKHKCFVLCDSWQEAIDEARLRLQGDSRAADALISVSS
jgi:hypothetical protein